MSLIPNNEAELLRLKFQMELVRTICPLIMILMQAFILLKIY